jgi:dipeptidase E
MKLLLLSNSTNFGESYMEWCKEKVASFVESASGNIVFIPYAAASFSTSEYTNSVNAAMGDFNIEVNNIESFENPIEAIQNASAIFVGGGNTFHLVKQLQDNKLIEAIQAKVKGGTPYVGWSAGSNIASPTICTTNDMPITQPQSFNSLNLIGIQINPHYTEATIPNHGGESRLQRLSEYIAVNPQSKVVCLPEASYLEQNGDQLKYFGRSNAKIIGRGTDQDIESSSVISVS